MVVTVSATGHHLLPEPETLALIDVSPDDYHANDTSHVQPESANTSDTQNYHNHEESGDAEGSAVVAITEEVGEEYSGAAEENVSADGSTTLGEDSLLPIKSKQVIAEEDAEGSTVVASTREVEEEPEMESIISVDIEKQEKEYRKKKSATNLRRKNDPARKKVSVSCRAAHPLQNGL